MSGKKIKIRKNQSKNNFGLFRYIFYTVLMIAALAGAFLYSKYHGNGNLDSRGVKNKFGEISPEVFQNIAGNDIDGDPGIINEDEPNKKRKKTDVKIEPQGEKTRTSDISQLSAAQIIDIMKLEPLGIEGGYYRETYRCKSPSNTDPARSCGTCIYYLLSDMDISKWHKVENDEMWIFHSGKPVTQLLLYPDGTWEERTMGPNIENGQVLQSLVPGGVWQAAVLSDRAKDSWAFFSVTVNPGFEFEDFTEGNPAELLKQYPAAAERMKELGFQ